MTQKEIKGLLESSEYDFLNRNKYIGNNIILLALGGSRAYGTNLPESDVDVRGIAINPSKQIFGLEDDFEQVVETNTDTTIYSLNKMTKLLLSCNPNTIEILGCRPEDYLYITPYGQKILDNKQNFLSVKAIDTFGGYARAQYNRLEHALLGNGRNDEKKLDMLLHSLQCALDAFNIKHQGSKSNIKLKILSLDKYKDVVKQQYEKLKNELNNKLTEDLANIKNNQSLNNQEKASKIQSLTDLFRNNMERLEENYLDNLDNANNNINDRIVISGEFINYPVGELQVLLREFHKIKSEYGNINKRNTKKDEIHMAKHMMHLLRLYKMGTKLNTDMEIHTNWDEKTRKC